MILQELQNRTTDQCILGGKVKAMGAPVRFTVFEVDVGSRELRKRGIRLHLPDQSFEILAMLVERPGDVITREEIRDRLWPDGTVVEFEHSVNSAVKRLRDCLGDSATTPRFIETLPRRGYRFVTPVEIGASALTMQEVRRDPDSGPPQATPAARNPVTRVRLVIGAGLAAGLIVFAVLGSYWLSRQRSPEPEAPLIAVPLTSYPGYESVPSFDPEGRQVAFQWCPDRRESNCDIYIKQIGVEEEPFRLTTDSARDFSPAWSPDGRFIAFLRKVAPTRVALIVIPQRGGQEQALSDMNWLTDRGYEQPYLAWTPDSKWIVCHQTERQNAGFLVNLQTRERRSMATLVRRQPYGPPVFSPDGRRLAFASHGLFLVHLAGGYLPRGEPERIVPESDEDSRERAPISNVAWMPDSNELVFVSRHSFWRVGASASATPRRIALDAEISSTPEVSRKGNRLAYAILNEDNNIWRIDLTDSIPGVPMAVAPSTRADSFPAFSPDSRRIAFNSNRSGPFEIWVCDRDGSNLSKLTSTGHSMWPRWSPDGRSIAFTSGRHVWVIDANGGAARRLTTDSASGKWPWWSRDGKSIYFTSTRGIAKMPATGGEAIPITPDGDRDVPKESPDGRFIYYQRGWPEQCSVWRMPVGGGEETMVLASVHRAGQWTVWEQGIYFFRPADEKGRSEICLYEFATGKIRKIQTIERPVSYSIATSPDGRTILYTQTDQSGSDLMLVENFR